MTVINARFRFHMRRVEADCERIRKLVARTNERRARIEALLESIEASAKRQARGRP